MLGMHSAPENSPLELYRLLANMIRRGRVQEVHVGSATEPATCMVALGEDLSTDFIPWVSLAAGGDKQTRHWRAPAIGEPCLVLAPEGELNQAVALLGLVSSDMPQGAADVNVERHDFSSTDFWEHNRPAGTLHFEIAHAISLKVGESVLLITPTGTTLTTPKHTVDSPETEFTGAVTVQKLLTFNGGMAGKAGDGSGGANIIQGGLAFEGGQVTHNGTRIDDGHDHPDPHGGSTGKPNR